MLFLHILQWRSYVRTYTCINCNNKILFVKKCLGLLWVFTDFSILLVASEHKHCDNVATNWKSENARSRMVASSAEKRGYGDKGRWVKYWARLDCWISTRYDPFSLGALFETYELFISLILQFFFSDRGKPQITETAHTGVRLYSMLGGHQSFPGHWRR
jgi:hypothetical protein